VSRVDSESARNLCRSQVSILSFGPLRWGHHGGCTNVHPGPAKLGSVYYGNMIEKPLSLALLGGNNTSCTTWLRHGAHGETVAHNGIATGPGSYVSFYRNLFVTSIRSFPRFRMLRRLKAFPLIPPHPFKILDSHLCAQRATSKERDAGK
jgi:hypothetical protein